jgi:hypothetical protein
LESSIISLGTSSRCCKTYNTCARGGVGKRLAHLGKVICKRGQQYISYNEKPQVSEHFPAQLGSKLLRAT